MGCTNGKPTKPPGNNSNPNPQQQANKNNSSQALPINNNNSNQQATSFVDPNHLNATYDKNKDNSNLKQYVDKPSNQISLLDQPKINQSGVKSNLENSGIKASTDVKNSYISGMQTDYNLKGSNLRDQKQNMSNLSNNHFDKNQLNTTDDEIVNQQNGGDFDLGIKFNMQVQVQ